MVLGSRILTKTGGKTQGFGVGKAGKSKEISAQGRKCACSHYDVRETAGPIEGERSMEPGKHLGVTPAQSGGKRHLLEGISSRSVCPLKVPKQGVENEEYLGHELGSLTFEFRENRSGQNTNLLLFHQARQSLKQGRLVTTRTHQKGTVKTQILMLEVPEHLARGARGRRTGVS